MNEIATPASIAFVTLFAYAVFGNIRREVSQRQYWKELFQLMVVGSAGTLFAGRSWGIFHQQLGWGMPMIHCAGWLIGCVFGLAFAGWIGHYIAKPESRNTSNPTLYYF